MKRSVKRTMNRARAIENTPRQVLLTVLLLFALAPAAQAQITSIPPLLQGQKSYHLWSIPYVLNTAGLATVVACTNVNTKVPAVIIGVEVFNHLGAAENDVSATSLSVPAGTTVTFGTAGLLAFGNDSNLGVSSLVRASARVLATVGRGIICNAAIIDALNAPPTSMTNVNIVKKTTQKGD